CDEGTLDLKIRPNVTAFHCHDDSQSKTGSLPSGAKHSFQIKSDLKVENNPSAFAGPLIEYVTPVSRGLEPKLNDAVVLLTGDHIDVSAAFQGMDPGSYRVRLDPVSGGEATAPSPVMWTNGSSARLLVPGLVPGLYKLGLLDADGELIARD